MRRSVAGVLATAAAAAVVASGVSAVVPLAPVPPGGPVLLAVVNPPALRVQELAWTQVLVDVDVGPLDVRFRVCPLAGTCVFDQRTRLDASGPHAMSFGPYRPRLATTHRVDLVVSSPAVGLRAARSWRIDAAP